MEIEGYYFYFATITSFQILSNSSFVSYASIRNLDSPNIYRVASRLNRKHEARKWYECSQIIVSVSPSEEQNLHVCNSVHYKHFGSKYFLHRQGGRVRKQGDRKQNQFECEDFYHTTRYHISHDAILYSIDRENLRPLVVTVARNSIEGLKEYDSVDLPSVLQAERPRNRVQFLTEPRVLSPSQRPGGTLTPTSLMSSA
jgi:hypothetical protein